MSKRHELPKTLQIEAKIADAIGISEIVTGVGIFLLQMPLVLFVHESVKTPYLFFCIFVAIMLTMQSKKNPQKRKWEELYLTVIAGRNSYEKLSIGASPRNKKPLPSPKKENRNDTTY